PTPTARRSAGATPSERCTASFATRRSATVFAAPAERRTHAMRRTPLERTPAAFEDADANLADVLEQLDDTKRYSAWIMEMIAPHICGTGLPACVGGGTR